MSGRNDCNVCLGKIYAMRELFQILILGTNFLFKCYVIILKIFGMLPSRNPTLTDTAGMQIRGCGLSSLNGARSQKGGAYE